MTGPRLFAAIRLPESRRRKLAAAALQFSKAAPGARPVPSRNLHLTLRFFGSEGGRVDRARIEAGLRRAEPLSAPVLALSGFSAFPSVRKARTVWAGFSEDPAAPSLLSLQRAAEAVARELGLDPERRPFVPHATISRFRAPTRIPEGALAALDAVADSSSRFIAVEFELLASTLTPDGAIHRRIARFPLGAR